MSKDNVLEYPRLDNEVIRVKNFLVIKKAKMKCGDITVLVGEQARGKSLLAKLRYFFWEYQQGLVRNFQMRTRYPVRTVSLEKSIDEYVNRRISFFCELFPNIENVESVFSIIFETDEFSISIKRDRKGSKIKIKHSGTLDAFIENVQEVFNDINVYLEKEFSSKNKIKKTKSSLFGTNFLFRRNFSSLLRERVDFSSVPSVLYVPASRLFFATVQDNIFRLMDSSRFEDYEEYSLDPLSKRFASFWEGQKEILSDEFKNSKRNKDWFKEANKVLAGNYVYKNRIDYIENNWGETVKLKDASSGQQNVLPLLAAINGFPDKNKKKQLLIIEEPEAHLYPESQRALVKMIGEVVRTKDCKAMITTHSPYIPACINNEIKIADNDEDSLDVTAYHVSDIPDGSDENAEDIYYTKYGLINVNKLDEASTQIANEYCKQLAIRTKKLKDKADKNND